MTDLVDLGKHSLQRGHPPFINILSPLLLVTHPILEFFNPPPPPNFMASQPFTDCVQIQYFNLYKILLWQYDGGHQGTVVLKCKAGLTQAVLNKIFRKDKTVCY